MEYIHLQNNAMQQTFEVEVRGPLAEQQPAHIEEYLKKHGTFIGEKKRVLIDYSFFLKGEGIAERTRDIRLRATNGVPEIIVKLGAWGGMDSKEELSVLTTKGRFDTLVKIFATLGYTRGMLCVRNSRVYTYRATEFAIVEVPDHSYYYETEKIVPTILDVPRTHEEIRQLCKEMGLSIFSNEDYFAYVEKLNKDVRVIFDFAHYTDGYFHTTFGI